MSKFYFFRHIYDGQIRVRRLNEHGFVNYLMERTPIPIAKSFLGENTAGLPSHEQKITTKVEEQSGEVKEIGLDHIRRVLLLFFTGIGIGLIVLVNEIITNGKRSVLVSIKSKLFKLFGRKKKISVKNVSTRKNLTTLAH